MICLTFEHKILSNMHEVKPLIAEILSNVQKCVPTLSEENAFELRLIFQELLFNSVIHGNRLNNRLSVLISIEIKNGVFYATIKDEGTGFDHSRLLLEFSDENVLASEHGRGVRLAKALSDSLEFNTIGNSIHFSKKVC